MVGGRAVHGRWIARLLPGVRRRLRNGVDPPVASQLDGMDHSRRFAPGGPEPALSAALYRQICSSYSLDTV